MRLYLAGNFTITDEVKHEVNLKKLLKNNYNRLCTFYYTRAADVIVKNENSKKIKKIIEINETDLNTKTHPMTGENHGQEKSKNCKENQSKKIVKRIKIKRRKLTV